MPYWPGSKEFAACDIKPGIGPISPAVREVARSLATRENVSCGDRDAVVSEAACSPVRDRLRRRRVEVTASRKNELRTNDPSTLLVGLWCIGQVLFACKMLYDTFCELQVNAVSRWKYAQCSCLLFVVRIARIAGLVLGIRLNIRGDWSAA